MSVTNHFFVVARATVFGVLITCAHADAQVTQTPANAFSATQDGITVQLEKVTVDRILNSRAWLKAKANASKQGKAIAEQLQEHLPARLVTFSVSVVGETKKMGVQKVEFAVDRRGVSSENRFFSPRKWRPRLPDIEVDPQAGGIESQHLITGTTQLSEIFPARIEVQVTTPDDKVLKFSFENIEF